MSWTIVTQEQCGPGVRTDPQDPLRYRLRDDLCEIQGCAQVTADATWLYRVPIPERPEDYVGVAVQSTWDGDKLCAVEQRITKDGYVMVPKVLATWDAPTLDQACCTCGRPW